MYFLQNHPVPLSLSEFVHPRPDVPPSSDDLEGQRSSPSPRHRDPELTSWLRLYGADQDSIDRVSPRHGTTTSEDAKPPRSSTKQEGSLQHSCALSLQILDEEYTLSDILNDVTRDDLKSLKLR